MTPDIFQLSSLKPLRLDERGLQKAILQLEKLTDGMESGGVVSPPDLLENLRKSLKSGLPQGRSFEECTSVKRRESLLLGLYLNDLSSLGTRAWLPPLNQNIAESILGKDPKIMKPHLRRLATQLYFTHYDRERLPCLDSLCRMLSLAWEAADSTKLDPTSRVWAENARVLFTVDAPDKVAAVWKSGMTANELADHYAIHEGSLFRERLIEALILNRIRGMSLTTKDTELNDQIVAEKDRVLATGLRLGAAAVQILVNRSQRENHSIVPECWSDQLVTFACDPRIPNNEMQSRWWGWATSTEKDVAIKALSKLSLEEFIRLLERSLVGTPQGHQFPERRNLLQKLFNKGLVIDARLVISRRIYQGLNAKTKEILNPSWLAGSQDTSFVCLRCTNDVYLIEGTHSFSLRGFIGEDAFPIEGYWNRPPRQYYDSQFRVHETRCPIYQKHQGRYWTWEFIQQLRRRHIEWDIFR